MKLNHSFYSIATQLLLYGFSGLQAQDLSVSLSYDYSEVKQSVELNNAKNIGGGMYGSTLLFDSIQRKPVVELEAHWPSLTLGAGYSHGNVSENHGTGIDIDYYCRPCFREGPRVDAMSLSYRDRLTRNQIAYSDIWAISRSRLGVRYSRLFGYLRWNFLGKDSGWQFLLDAGETFTQYSSNHTVLQSNYARSLETMFFFLPGTASIYRHRHLYGQPGFGYAFDLSQRFQIFLDGGFVFSYDRGQVLHKFRAVNHKFKGVAPGFFWKTKVVVDLGGAKLLITTGQNRIYGRSYEETVFGEVYFSSQPILLSYTSPSSDMDYAAFHSNIQFGLQLPLHSTREKKLKTFEAPAD